MSGLTPAPRRFLSDLEIAQRATYAPLIDVAAGAGIPADCLIPYGDHVAKIRLSAIEEMAGRPAGRYVVVSAITPTPLGEGKTTTTVGLGQALARIGRRATVAIRQPSMGPTFGIKGGAAGGGYSQVVPMERLNLHLTGDFHAITAAHNMLAALVENHLYQGNACDLDLDDITWRRVLDVNDRSLRNVVVGLGSVQDGVPARPASTSPPPPRSWPWSACPPPWPTSAGDSNASSSATPATAPRSPPGMSGGRGHGRHPDRRPPAEPPPDPRAHAGARPHRALWQHRPRQLVGRGRPDRHPGGRVPRHRGRIRGGHGGRTLLQHQVPGVGARARRRRGRRHRPGHEGPLGPLPLGGRPTAARGAVRREPRGRARRRGQPGQAAREHHPARGDAGRGHQRLPGDHPSEHRAIAEIAAAMRHAARPSAPISPMGVPGPPSWPRPWSRRRPGRRASASSIPTTWPCARRSPPSPPGCTAPAASPTPRPPPDRSTATRTRGSAVSGLHRQDPPVDVGRPRRARGPGRVAPAGTRGPGLGRGRLHLPHLRRHAHDARPRPHPAAFDIDIDPDDGGRVVGLF